MAKKRVVKSCVDQAKEWRKIGRQKSEIRSTSSRRKCRRCHNWTKPDHEYCKTCERVLELPEPKLVRKCQGCGLPTKNKLNYCLPCNVKRGVKRSYTKCPTCENQKSKDRSHCTVCLEVLEETGSVEPIAGTRYRKSQSSPQQKSIVNVVVNVTVNVNIADVIQVGKTYLDRNNLLRDMEYSTYGEYRQSNLWKNIKKSAWRKHGRVCRLCQSGAIVLHHLDYSENVLRGITLYQLVPLCNECHDKVELDENGIKQSLAQSQKVYWRLLKEVENL